MITTIKGGYGAQGKYGGSIQSMATIFNQLGQLEQTRRQNQQINDFLDLTSKGIDPQTALIQIAQKGTQYSGGLGGMFQKFSGGAGMLPAQQSILAPLVAKAVIENAYGQTRQRSNKFETFVGEDGKTHKGVFDNEGNMIKDMGIAPSPSSMTGKSDDEKLLDFYDARIKGISTYDKTKSNKAKLDFYTKKRDGLLAKQETALGGEKFQTLVDGSIGKKVQEAQDIISDVEDTDIEAAAKGGGMKKGMQDTENLNDPNAVINDAYTSGVINDDDLAVISQVLKQDPAKIKDILAMIKQKKEKSVGK
ncbi:MAG: hypothetical protein WC356_03595 [Candidatus Micrarchaeia archaeon]|jgi:hypothetical protein